MRRSDSTLSLDTSAATTSGPTMTSPAAQYGTTATTTPSILKKDKKNDHDNDDHDDDDDRNHNQKNTTTTTKADYLQYLTSYETMVRQQDTEYEATLAHIGNNVFRRVQRLGKKTKTMKTKSSSSNDGTSSGKKMGIEEDSSDEENEGILTYIQMRRCLLRLGIGWKRPMSTTLFGKDNMMECSNNDRMMLLLQYDDDDDVDNDDISVLSFHSSTSSRQSGSSSSSNNNNKNHGSVSGRILGTDGASDILITDSQLIMLLVTLVEMEERYRVSLITRINNNNNTLCEYDDGQPSPTRPPLRRRLREQGLYLPDFIFAYKLIIGGMQSIKKSLSVNIAEITTTTSPTTTTATTTTTTSQYSTNNDFIHNEKENIAFTSMLHARMKERTLTLLQPFGPDDQRIVCHKNRDAVTNRDDDDNDDDSMPSSIYERGSHRDIMRDRQHQRRQRRTQRLPLAAGGAMLYPRGDNSTILSTKRITSSSSNNGNTTADLLVKNILRTKDQTLAKIMEEHESEIENVKLQMEALRSEELQTRKKQQRKRNRSILFAILLGCGIVLVMGRLLEKYYSRLFIEEEWVLLEQREQERRDVNNQTIELLHETKMELEKKLHVVEGKMRYQVDRTNDMKEKMVDITQKLKDTDMKMLLDSVEIERCRISVAELSEGLKNEKTKNENGNEELIWCRSRSYSLERELNELEHVGGSSSSTTASSSSSNSATSTSTRGTALSQFGITKFHSDDGIHGLYQHNSQPVYLEMKYNKSIRNSMLLRQIYSASVGMAISALLHGLMSSLFLPKAASVVLAPFSSPSAAVVLSRAEKIVDGIFGSSVAFLLIRAIAAFVSAL